MQPCETALDGLEPRSRRGLSSRRAARVNCWARRRGWWGGRANPLGTADRSARARWRQRKLCARYCNAAKMGAGLGGERHFFFADPGVSLGQAFAQLDMARAARTVSVADSGFGAGRARSAARL